MAFNINSLKSLPVCDLKTPSSISDWNFETVEDLPKPKNSKWELLDWDWKIRRILSNLLEISPILCAYHGTYKGEENMIKLVLITKPKTLKTIYIHREYFETSITTIVNSFLSEIYELKKVPKEKIRKKVPETKESPYWTTLPF